MKALDTGPPCNNGCAVCPRSSAGAGFLPVDGPLAGEGALVIHGGEPTLHSDLDDLIARARLAGRPVTLDTNGRAFAVEGRARSAVAAGLTHAVVTLHGAREASHDFLTRTPGSFRQAIAGAMRLRAVGARLTVRLMVTRSSLTELGAMATTALGLGPAAVRFSFARMEPRPDGPRFVRGRTWVHGTLEEPITVHPTPAGDIDGYDLSREWLVPRYPLALEPLAAAARVVQRVGRPVTVDGAPACLAPPGVPVSTSGPACYLPSPVADVFAPACDGCALRAACPGLPAGYLARFGAGELVPLLQPAALRR